MGHVTCISRWVKGNLEGLPQFVERADRSGHRAMAFDGSLLSGMCVAGCVAVCVAVFCSVLQCVAECMVCKLPQHPLQCVAACCSVFEWML